MRHPSGPLLELGHALQQEGYRFVTVTPLTHARVNRRSGNALAQDLAGIFGWNRPFARDTLPASLFELMAAAELLEEAGSGWRSRMRAATLGGQLYFHSAWPTTASDAVFFGPDSYRFVALLEQEVAMLASPPNRIADIGCGAGPGAISLARLFPEAEVIAGDINPGAIATCQINALLAGASNVAVQASNLLHDVSGDFDLIVANPPYLVDRDERTYRHGGGALGGDLSLAIVETALHRLAAGGSLVLYTGSAIVDGEDALLRMVEGILRETSAFSWRYREMDPDIFGEELEGGAYVTADRIAAVALVVTRES